jgi:hypothetical protein
MTVGQLIKKLQELDPNLPVVVRTPTKGFPDDFGDLNASDLAIVNTAKLFNDPHWGKQIYDASENPASPRTTKVLSLSGPSTFDRLTKR